MPLEYRPPAIPPPHHDFPYTSLIWCPAAAYTKVCAICHETSPGLLSEYKGIGCSHFYHVLCLLEGHRVSTDCAACSTLLHCFDREKMDMYDEQFLSRLTRLYIRDKASGIAWQKEIPEMKTLEVKLTVTGLNSETYPQSVFSPRSLVNGYRATHPRCVGTTSHRLLARGMLSEQRISKSNTNTVVRAAASDVQVDV